MQAAEIGKLIDEVVKLGNSPANLELKVAWDRFYAFKEPGKVPVKAWMNDSGWAQYLGYDMVSIFEDPEKYLQFRLECILHQHTLFPDDTPVPTSIGVAFGPTLVPSLFGVAGIPKVVVSPCYRDALPRHHARKPNAQLLHRTDRLYGFHGHGT